MDAAEEERGAQPELRHLVTMGFGNALDETVQAQPPQIISHPTGGKRFGRLPGERGEMRAQVAMRETARQETEPEQSGPQRQDAGIRKA